MKKHFGFLILCAFLFNCSYSQSTATNRLDSTGNVGIGTLSPAYTLHVVGNAKITDSRSNTFIGGGNTTLTGTNNIAIGEYAATKLTIGNGNLSVGKDASMDLTVGSNNFAMGSGALFHNQNGDGNMAIGNVALFYNTNGSQNIGIGLGTLQNMNAYYNIGIGNEVGKEITTGNYNTIIGHNTGRGIATGNSNTIIGGNVENLPQNLSNTVILADGVGSTRFYSEASGKVGIGTTQPSAKLSVSGSGIGDGIAVSGNSPSIAISGNGTTSLLQFGMSSFNGMYSSTMQTGDGIIRLVNGSSGAMRIENQQNGPVAFATTTSGSFGTTERVRITPAGDMGIGTETPSAKLDVNGVIQTYNKDVSTATGDNMRLWSDGANSFIQSNGDENGLRIKSNGANKIFMESNVGIGTTELHNYRLAVNGDAIFTKIKVRLYNAWPDYVFRPSYKLPSLEQVAAYVNQHHHLPGVVSEAEVAKNGLDLAENQAALLRKIEELTLYVIDLQRQVNKQNATISKLRGKILNGKKSQSR